jgi:hypothetical protein
MIAAGSGPQQAGMLSVPCYRLDTLVGAEPGVESVALIKLDVEGSELKVLRGASAVIQRDHPALYVENDRLENSAPLIEWLLERGYRLWWHMAPAFNPQNFLKNENNIYGDVVSINMIGLHPCHGASVDGLPEILDRGDHPLRTAAFRQTRVEARQDAP